MCIASVVTVAARFISYTGAPAGLPVCRPGYMYRYGVVAVAVTRVTCGLRLARGVVFASSALYNLKAYPAI